MRRGLRGAMVWIALAIGIEGMAGVAWAQERESLTLPIAVDIALRSHPLVRATASGGALAEAQLEEARRSRWPTIQLSETVTRGNNPVFAFGSLLEQGRFTQQNFFLPRLNNPEALTNFRVGVSMRMPVFDQRQASTRIRQAALRREQAGTQTEQVAQRIRFEVIRSYFGLLLARSRRQVTTESVRLAEADVELSRNRVELGTAVVADLLAAEVQLSEVRQQQIEATGEEMTALAALNTAMGIAIETPQVLSGELGARTFPLESQEGLLREALQNRPELVRAGLAIESGQAGVRGARSEYLPRVDLFTSAGASRHDWINGSGDYTVGVSITFQLLDAGRGARVAQARAAAEIAAGEQDHLRQQIQFEVVEARQRVRTAAERMVVAERTTERATEALRIVQDRYREGLTTMTELLRAQTALTRTRLQVLAARYDYYVGYAGLLLTTGQLTGVGPFVS